MNRMNLRTQVKEALPASNTHLLVSVAKWRITWGPCLHFKSICCTSKTLMPTSPQIELPLTLPQLFIRTPLNAGFTSRKCGDCCAENDTHTHTLHTFCTFCTEWKSLWGASVRWCSEVIVCAKWHDDAKLLLKGWYHRYNCSVTVNVGCVFPAEVQC